MAGSKVPGLLAASAVAGSLVLGAAWAVRDEVRLLRDGLPGARETGWTGSESDRLRYALTGWSPIVEAVRRATPEDAVLCGWIDYDAPGAGSIDLFTRFAVALAPRLCVPLDTPAAFRQWRPRFAEAGLPVYALEIHPSFVPGARPRPASPFLPEAAAARVVAEGADFTLYGIDRVR